MVADRILISSNTISHILNNFFIWAYRKILFDVSNIGVVRWKDHLQCPIFQVSHLPVLVFSPLGEIAPNGDNKR